MSTECNNLSPITTFDFNRFSELSFLQNGGIVYSAAEKLNFCRPGIAALLPTNTAQK